MVNFEAMVNAIRLSDKALSGGTFECPVAKKHRLGLRQMLFVKAIKRLVEGHLNVKA